MPAPEFKQHRLWGKLALGALAVLLPLVLFETTGFLKAFELQYTDAMMKMRGQRAPNPDLILVTLDDQTANALGSPLPRRYYVQLLRALQEYGAKTIAFDLQFMAHNDAEADVELAKLMQSSGNVIQPFLFYYRQEEGFNFASEIATPPDSAYAQFAVQPREDANLAFIHADSAILPHRIFIEKTAKAGLVFIYPDDDGEYRRLPLLCKSFGKIYAASSLATICDFQRLSPDSLQIRQDFWGYYLRLPSAPNAINIPINRQALIQLNFYGPFEAFKSYSMLDIFQSLEDIAQRKAPRVPLRDFAGKIVLIGTNETMRKDFFVTPFAEDFPGMGIHATAISNFLNGDSLRELPWRFEAGLTIILALVLNGGVWLAGRVNKARETVYAWLIFGGILLAFNLIGYFLLFQSLHIVPPMLKINSALALMFLATTFYEKSWRVKVLNREVGRLEGEMKIRQAEMETLNAKISARDDEYKTLNFLIKDFENLLVHPSAEMTNLLQHPVARMHIIKEQIQNELEQLHDNKQRLESENQALVSQMRILKEIPSPALEKTAAPPLPAPEPPEKKMEDVRRVMEHYQGFVQKAKVKHHFDPALGMVTAVMNGRLEGEAQKNKMQDIFTQIAHFGSFDATVLITGETGTGKDMVARAIQKNSRRKQGPFIAINIAEFPENLIEDELFGHAKGAYTGAQGEREGAFERAHGGTIFLDEIGDLKYELQAKLLRVLQEKTVTRLGSNEPIKVDFRIIAATNHDLKKLIDEKKFREDLYYRLNVARLHLPALRERKDEIPHLVSYFLAKFNDDNKKQKRLNDDALTAMILHDWPGNIRELQNFLERAYIKSGGDTIGLDDLDDEIQKSYGEVFNQQFISMWDGILAAARAELDRLLLQCQELLRTGNVEQALQAGQLRLEEAPCKNCYEYVKAFLDSKGSLFPPDRREELAKQTIVAMSEQLAEWCSKQKIFGSMEQAWREIEKLLGRVRRQITNWKHEVGLGPFN